MKNNPVHKKEYDRLRYQKRKKEVKKKHHEYYLKNSKDIVAKTLAYRKLHPLQWMLCRAKERAKRLGIAFNLTEKDLSPLPTRCPILGIKLEFFTGGSGGRSNSASLDRILPHLGYVSGNVAIISNKANYMKNNNTPETLVKILEYIRRAVYAQ